MASESALIAELVLERKLKTEALYQAELEAARATVAEAMVERLKGLLHAEVIAEMEYCELHELAFMSPMWVTPRCPHCRADAAEDALKEPVLKIVEGRMDAQRWARLWKKVAKKLRRGGTADGVQPAVQDDDVQER